MKEPLGSRLQIISTGPTLRQAEKGAWSDGAGMSVRARSQEVGRTFGLITTPPVPHRLGRGRAF